MMSDIRSRLAELSSEEKEHFLGEVPRLLLEGRRIKRLSRLLSNYDFIEAKINHPDFGVKALIEDYDLIDKAKLLNNPEYDSQTIKSLKLIQGALRLSAHILIQDTKQLAGQLSARLLDFETSEIKQLLQQIYQTKTTCLRSLRASLSNPSEPLELTLSGHIDSVNAVAVTPDGKRIISGSSDNTVKVWDLNIGAEVFTFTGHSSSVNAVAVTPDGKRIISGSSDNTVRVWDLNTGKEILIFNGHSSPVNAVAVSPDGKKVVTASTLNTNNIKVWNLETGKEDLALESDLSHISTLAITSGNLLIIDSYDRIIKILSLETGKVLFELDCYIDRRWGIKYKSSSHKVTAIAVSPDGKRLIASVQKEYSLYNFFYYAILIWDLETNKRIQTIDVTTGPIVALTFTPDGKRLIFASLNKPIIVWEIESRQKLLTLTGYNESIYAITTTPDGKKLISASKDKTLKVWNLDSGENNIKVIDDNKKVIDDNKSVNALTFTIDGKQVICGLKDSIVKIWDLEKIKPILSFALDKKDSIYFHKKKYVRWILGVWEIVLLFIFFVSLNRLTSHVPFIISLSILFILHLIIFTVIKHNSKTNIKDKKITALCVTPNSNWIIYVNRKWLDKDHCLTAQSLNKKNHIVDLLTPLQCISQIFYLSIVLTSLYVFSYLLSFCKTFCWWWLFPLSLIYILYFLLFDSVVEKFSESIKSISITPNGKYLISGSTDKTIKVWNLQTKKLLFILKGHSKEVSAVTTTPDGKYLISGSDDKTIKIWNLKNRKQLFTLTGHEDSINTISITPDGNYLISGSDDKTIKIWNLENREEIFTFTGHTESINEIKVTSNGQLVISASSDKTIQVFDFKTGKVIAKFTGESGINCCAVAPDDVTIVAGDTAGNAHFLCLQGIEV